MKNPWQLESLVKAEKTLTNYCIAEDDNIGIAISCDKATIEISINSQKYTANLNRAIIHQLVSKVLKGDNAYEKAYPFWKNQITFNQSEFFKSLIVGLKKSNAIIKYFPDKRVYGIVTPYFKEINQIEFRDNFITELKNVKEFSDETKFIVDRYGRLIEIFTPKFSTHNFEYKYCLIYGQNNGYSAIKVYWARKVIVCSNGLTSFNGPQFKLIHNNLADYKTFLQLSVEKGISNYKVLNQQLLNLSGMKFSSEELLSHLGGITIEKFIKDKVVDRFGIESKQTGMNRWSYSQALTWLAEHDNQINPRNRYKLKLIGTKVLDETHFNEYI